jgi:hypothetical protein
MARAPCSATPGSRGFGDGTEEDPEDDTQIQDSVFDLVVGRSDPSLEYTQVY